MKTMKALITAVSLFGLIEGSAAMAADGVVSKDALGAGSYCHM